MRIVSETELRYLARGASYEWLRQAFKRNLERIQYNELAAKRLRARASPY